MKYQFKVAQELTWAFGVGIGVVVLEMLVKFDPSTITDWQTWAIASGAAVLRGGAATALPVILRAVSKLPGRVG